MQTNNTNTVLAAIAAVQAETIRLSNAIANEKDPAIKLDLENQLKALVEGVGFQLNPDGFVTPAVQVKAAVEDAKEAIKEEADAATKAAEDQAKPTAKVGRWTRLKMWTAVKFYQTKNLVTDNPAKSALVAVAVVAGVVAFVISRGRVRPVAVDGAIVNGLEGAVTRGFFGNVFAAIGNGLATAGNYITGAFYWVGGKLVSVKDGVVGFFSRPVAVEIVNPVVAV